MSAYLVSNKSISVIAKSIEYWAKLKPRYSDHNEIYNLLNKYHNQYLTQPSYGETEIKIAEKIFGKLLEINLLSLGQKYDNIKDWSNSGETYKYDPQAPTVNIPVLIDLLDNWQYQACEGVAEESDFYKLMETLQDKLAREFVKRQQNEDDKLWGIDDYSELKKIKGAYAY